MLRQIVNGRAQKWKAAGAMFLAVFSLLKLALSNPLFAEYIIRNMRYLYLIQRLVPFALGFLTAVFVTSLFQAVGSFNEYAHVPEVSEATYSKAYSCKYRLRGYGDGYGSGSGIGDGTDTSKTGSGGLKVLHKPAPEYTPEARQNHTEGTIMLRITFLSDGSIGSVMPLNELDDGLTEKAVAAAWKIRFEPARRNGTPVTTTKVIEYRFSIY